MPEKLPFPLLHVRPSDVVGDPHPVASLMRALRGEEGVDQREVVLPPGPWPLGLWRVGRALGELVEPGAGAGDGGDDGSVEDEGGGDGRNGRRAVQWPVPDRWPVVHAHGADALRAVWVAAAWRGSAARVVAGPLPAGPGGGSVDGSASGSGDDAKARPAGSAGSDGTGAAAGGGSGGEPGVRVPVAPWRKADLVAAPDRGTREALARRGVEYRRLRVAPPGDAEAALRLYRRLAYAERRRVQRVDWSVAGAGPPGADGAGDSGAGRGGDGGVGSARSDGSDGGYAGDVGEGR